MRLSQKFRDTLTLVHQRFNALQRGEKRCFGLTASQCFLIEWLQRAGSCGVRELSEALGLDQSSVTRAVDVLERDGLVRRARDEGQDRRRVFVSLTDTGHEMAAKLDACTAAFCHEILKRIPADRRADVVRALRVLVDVVEERPKDFASA